MANKNNDDRKRIIVEIIIDVIAAIIMAVIVLNETVNAAYVHNIPKNYGYMHTYTMWDKVKWRYDCAYLKNFAYENECISDSYGIVKYGGYFCGALTSRFGKVGDLLLVVEENNIVYPVIIADTKSMNDKNCNSFGHYSGKCIVEFEILSSQRRSLYGSSGGYISDKLAKPIVKIINLGSVFDSTHYLWSPYKACVDNNLIGYELLVSPYDSVIVYNHTEDNSMLRESENGRIQSYDISAFRLWSTLRYNILWQYKG